ncbi:MAG: phosphoribulokinase [Arenicella sp.]
MTPSSHSVQLEKAIDQLITQKKLPVEFNETVLQFYLPLCESLVGSRETGKPTIVGVQGAQGTGKSTCAAFLKLLLENQFNLKTVVTSLDDFYLTRAQRSQLGVEVHPLFATRGVPGTHDIELLQSVIDSIQKQVPGETYSIPLFDKAIDDRCSHENWLSVDAPVDILILEGWCVGMSPQQQQELTTPVNALESDEDPDGIWRKYVNDQLKCDYADLFAQLDFLVALQAPSFDCVYQWRSLQEEKLIASLQQGQSRALTMNTKQLRRFISHYERLTRHGLATLPDRANWLIQLREDHSVSELISK